MKIFAIEWIDGNMIGVIDRGGEVGGWRRMRVRKDLAMKVEALRLIVL